MGQNQKKLATKIWLPKKDATNTKKMCKYFRVYRTPLYVISPKNVTHTIKMHN